MNHRVIHYKSLLLGFVPCGENPDIIYTTFEPVKVTCKHCLRWWKRRLPNGEKGEVG